MIRRARGSLDAPPSMTATRTADWWQLISTANQLPARSPYGEHARRLGSEVRINVP
jgi:hypothetical protein